MRFAWALVPLLVAGGAQAPPSPPPSPRPGLTHAEAESLRRKLEAVEARHRAGAARRAAPVAVSEAELNSYLNLGRGVRLPRGVSDVEIRLLPDRVAARGLVDLEAVGGQVSVGAWSPLSFLMGKVPLEARGRVTSKDGFGTLEVEEVRLASVPVPLSALEQMVVAATRTTASPHGFDIHAPFRLPYSVRRVRVEPARAWLEF